VKLHSWPASAIMFDGETTAGPVPTLFSEDQEATLRAITANKSRAHHDIQRIAKVFLAGETIGLPDCATILKKPR